MLVLSVGGDTLTGITQLVNKVPSRRPLSLELLWKVLQRGQEVSSREWRLVRVAIVAMRHGVYIGRIFFGDPETGEIAWDCDARPSDCCWLALQSSCPFFIHRNVWKDHAMLTEQLIEPPPAASSGGGAVRAQGGAGAAAQTAAAAAAAATAGSPAARFTAVQAGDPEPIKLLKLEMHVALLEEDYEAAARIRDHPWMQLHLAIEQAAAGGDVETAARLEARLQAALMQHEGSPGSSEHSDAEQ